MKKGTFYKKIRAKKEAKGFTFEKAEGYIEAKNGWVIAYHKDKSGRYWCATDTETGLSVCEFKKTRKEAVATTSDKVARLNEFRKTEDYKNYLKDMADFFSGKTETPKKEQEGENEMKQKKKGTQRNQGMTRSNGETIRMHSTRVKGLSRAGIKRLEHKEKAATWERNVDHAGIEITFKEKPEKAVRDMLKSVGFRWHNTKQLWYAKETEARVKVAEMVCA